VLFFALCGEGMGHATRSWPVIRHFSERYEVHVFAGGRVHEYLVSRVEHLHWIQTLALVYRDNRVDVGASVRTNFAHLAQIIWSFVKFISLALALRPHVLVTDFEAISTYASFPLRLKTVAFDNQHILRRAAVRYPARYERDARAASRAIFWTVPWANRYVISTFFLAPITRPHTRIVPPVVRPEVLELSPVAGDTVLVYQTSDSNRRLVPVLNQVDARFVVYGLHRDQEIGNCTLRAFSEVRFLEDLARARAVITNGGHTLITEALALGKPVLCEPVLGQFEQALNALVIDELGYGAAVDCLTPDAVRSFLAAVDRHARTIRERYPAADNAIALQGLEDAIHELSPLLREVMAPTSRPVLEQREVQSLLIAHHPPGVEGREDGR
jgi:uncharacterized protein (TIGR00661 family)